MDAPHSFAAAPARVSALRRAVRAAKRWLFWFHRWLGVVTCLLCVMWFLSGLVMLYVPFPSWDDAERIASLPPVAIGQVRVLPDEAMARAGARALPETFRLEMFAGEPVYRIVSGDLRTSISAVTGDSIANVTADQAAKHLAQALPQAQPTLESQIDYDQWTRRNASIHTGPSIASR